MECELWVFFPLYLIRLRHTYSKHSEQKKMGEKCKENVNGQSDKQNIPTSNVIKSTNDYMYIQFPPNFMSTV